MLRQIQWATPSSYQVFNGYHQVLAGQARSKFVCVCLQCGKFLGVCSSWQQIAVIEKVHTCHPGELAVQSPR
jgi:hypothetical protein